MKALESETKPNQKQLATKICASYNRCQVLYATKCQLLYNSKQISDVLPTTKC